MDASSFKDIVAKFIDYDRNDGTYKYDKVDDLAHILGCHRSKIVHFAAGTMVPGPNTQQAVIEYIRQQTNGS